MTTTHHVTLSPSLFLVEQTLDVQREAANPTPTDHIMMIDCSGSMAADLPKIREQLKRRLTSLVNDGDTFTLIWFSGCGQCDVLINADPIGNLADLQRVNQQIDRWLRPIGLTGFVDPLVEATLVIGRLTAANRRGARVARRVSIFFMSDGEDNQYPKQEIMLAIDRLRHAGVAAATIVEYGYYADRRMLTSMAEALGGVHVFAEAFDKYEPVFERVLKRPGSNVPRREIAPASQPLDLAFTIDGDGEIKAYEARTSKLAVDADTTALYFLTNTRPAMSEEIICVDAREPGLHAALYAALSLYAARMRPNIVHALLRASGDVRFINMFATCFGKQRYTEFMEAARLAAIDPDERLLLGYDPARVPRDDAFTIFHLLELLQSDPSTRVILDHPAFKYSRISRRRVDADETLSIDEQQQVDEIRAAMGNTRNAKVLKNLQSELDAILASKRDALKFVADPAPDGYAIEGLKFHETRPNISILVKKQGTVDLHARFTAAEGGEWKIGFPRKALDAFPTHIWRNYAIVSNGLVNVDKLPVKISAVLERRLWEFSVPTEEAEGGVTIIDLRRIPILNRAMVDAVSMAEAARLEFELARSRAFQKVYKAVVAENHPEAKQASFVDRYGEEGAAWLKAQGITEGGFAPKMVVSESIDYITGRELDIKLAGYSTLPPVAAVKAKLAKLAGDRKVKLNGPETLMTEALDEIEAISSKHVLVGRTCRASFDEVAAAIKKALIERERSLITETRALILRAARMKFAITVGQAWFREFKSIDETSLEVRLDNRLTVKATAELREIQIKI